MSVDLACGERAFLDLTFVGLEGLPGPGQERLAYDLVRSPGGGAITAIGAARLGLRCAAASPIGADADGDYLRSELAREGVRWAGRQVARTAVTAVLPCGGERAMATYDPGESATAEELAAVTPAAVVLGIPRLALAPAGARVYATIGDVDSRDGLAAGDLEGADVLLVNAREAEALTGSADPAEAARVLAERVPTVVVTLGADGALAIMEGTLLRAPGVPTPVVDTTGAGDLFCAAFAWADARGFDLGERLAWAVLYAALSVAVPTGVAGAVTQDELLAAGEDHGLPLPPGAQTLDTTRRNA